MIRGVREAIEDLNVFEFTAELLLGLEAVAGADEYRTSLDGGSGLKIPQRVANGNNIYEGLFVVLFQLFEETGLRLATVAIVVRAVRADDNAVDTAPGLVDQRVHPGVHRVESAPIEEAAGKPGLVGRDG